MLAGNGSEFISTGLNVVQHLSHVFDLRLDPVHLIFNPLVQFRATTRSLRPKFCSYLIPNTLGGLLIQFFYFEEVVTWPIYMLFQFWSSPILFKINDHATQLVRKNAFGPNSNYSNFCYCSNFTFAPVRAIWKWIKNVFFEQIESRDHSFRREFGWIKSETARICITWLPPPNQELDQKLYPRVYTRKYTAYKHTEIGSLWWGIGNK